jgi:hypothetical protein
VRRVNIVSVQPIEIPSLKITLTKIMIWLVLLIPLNVACVVKHLEEAARLQDISALHTTSLAITVKNVFNQNLS